MSLKFTTVYHKEGKWYVAYCPELGVASQGENLEDAQKNLQEAIELYLEDLPQEELRQFTESSFIQTIEIPYNA